MLTLIYILTVAAIYIGLGVSIWHSMRWSREMELRRENQRLRSQLALFIDLPDADLR